VRFFVASGASVAIAWISRKYYEQWFLDMKKYFTPSAIKPVAVSTEKGAS
jgi:hypothetical protein